MANYSNVNDNSYPFGGGNPQMSQSTGYITPYPAKKAGTSKWIKIGIPVAVVVIIAAVVGGVVGSKASKNSSASSNGGAGSAGGEAAASSAHSAQLAIGRFATATNSYFQVPIYPSTTNTAAFSEPTFLASNNAQLAWPEDSFKPSSPSVTTVRDDRPRLIAPAYKWAALPNLIANNVYLKGWNDTIFGNATDYYSKDPVTYFMDGDSGILDNAREIKMRVKAFAYAYRMSNDTKWVERCWNEIENAGSSNFGPTDDKWNAAHFLDPAEFTAAYAIAYDWLYDQWTDERKSTMRDTMIKYGLQPGIAAYTDATVYTGWWKEKTEGNWNCVCNNGLTMGSLAILGDDTTGAAKQLLGLTVDNAKENCALAPSDDGTWSETANYWYFGTTGHAEMAASLISATGSDYDLLNTNSKFSLTGLYHMAAYGPTSLFDWGDHGPNKFSSTANSMLFYGDQYTEPRFTLFQRDRSDAADPFSMFWYDPSVSGAYWDDLELDHFFDNTLDQWVSMRSSWTDINALYVGMKAGKLVGHQTHNDLDVGDFVLDAMGTRWAGEFGSGDYRSTAYFSNDTQGSARWTYYRKMTEGQNTITIGYQNQDVNAAPTVKHDSSGTKQGSSTVMDVPSDSTAFWTTDMTSAYFDATSVKRGVRMLNGRKQVLIQDEINASKVIEWRMHTNATVTISDSTVTLERDGKTMKMTVLNPPSGMEITKTDAKRSSNSVVAAAPQADQENPGVSTVLITIPAGQATLQVLFNPQWDGMSDSDFVTPKSVALDDWSLTSHN